MSQENQSQEAQGVQITPTDILNAHQIIKLAMERGNTFTAEELVQVSGVFSKLNDFAVHIQQQQQAAEAAKEEAAKDAVKGE